MKYSDHKWLLLLILILITSCSIESPILLYPIDGETVSLPVTLVWSHVRASEYWAMIDTTTDFHDPIIWVRISDTTYEVTALTPGLHYWCVEAHAEDQSSCSETESFRIE